MDRQRQRRETSRRRLRRKMDTGEAGTGQRDGLEKDRDWRKTETERHKQEVDRKRHRREAGREMRDGQKKMDTRDGQKGERNRDRMRRETNIVRQTRDAAQYDKDCQGVGINERQTEKHTDESETGKNTGGKTDRERHRGE